MLSDTTNSLSLLNLSFNDSNSTGKHLSHTESGFTGDLLEGTTRLPPNLRFSELGLITVIVYGVLFVFAAGGNLTVFITLFRNRHRKSRVNTFILHLSTADLIVTFVFMPLEFSWHLTVSWLAGDAACRVLMFFRAFGFYLSSFILVVISLDRYFAILHPLSLNEADKRSQLMLAFAWMLSFIAAVPQSVIFHVEKNPQFPAFEQCVTFNFFQSKVQELVYNMFTIITIYVVPLVVIVISYSLILCEMTRKSREYRDGATVSSNPANHNRLRRSNCGQIQRARSKTLLMTFMMVSAFFVCWTPYFVMSLWWWFDSKTADAVDNRIQKGLFFFAVSNSCVNPLVYGIFTLNLEREFRRCCLCLNGKPKPSYYEMVTQSATLHGAATAANLHRPSFLTAMPVHKAVSDTYASKNTARKSYELNGNTPKTDRAWCK